MLKKENLRSPNRCKFLKKCLEMGLSSHIKVELTECMDGKTDIEKEFLAEQLLEIILTSTTEQEMIDRAKTLK